MNIATTAIISLTPPQPPKSWYVRIRKDKASGRYICHELCYRGTVQLKATGHLAILNLRAQADHLNTMTNNAPSKRIMCAADAPNPDRYVSACKYLTPVKTKRQLAAK